MRTGMAGGWNAGRSARDLQEWRHDVLTEFPAQYHGVVEVLANHAYVKFGPTWYSQPERQEIIKGSGYSSATVTRRLTAIVRAGYLRPANSGCADGPTLWNLRIPREDTL